MLLEAAASPSLSPSSSHSGYPSGSPDNHSSALPASAHTTALPSSSLCPRQAQKQGWQQSAALLGTLLWWPGEMMGSDVWWDTCSRACWDALIGCLQWRLLCYLLGWNLVGCLLWRLLHLVIFQDEWDQEFKSLSHFYFYHSACLCVLSTDTQMYINNCFYRLCRVPAGMVPDSPGFNATLPASPHRDFQSSLNASTERADINS